VGVAGNKELWKLVDGLVLLAKTIWCEF